MGLPNDSVLVSERIKGITITDTDMLEAAGIEQVTWPFKRLKSFLHKFSEIIFFMQICTLEIYL